MAAARELAGVAGECAIDEHGYCHGNVDLKVPGLARAVPMLRCSCSCHIGDGVSPRAGGSAAPEERER